jgi:TatD DNase family protein
MTDAHCHVSCGDPSVREFLVGRDFFGVHPWETLGGTVPQVPLIPRLRSILLANPGAGVGEIGLDRLRVRDIPPLMREVFEAQLALAFELRRPVVLHGAKCWGQVVGMIKNHELRIMNYGGNHSLIHNSSFIIHNSFLFHGFSRSDGLIPDIVALNGYISVGPAVLNDHAVNYRELVKRIPLERLLVETDRTDDSVRRDIREVLAKTAEVVGIPAAELERVTDENAQRFMSGTPAVRP